MDNKTSDKSVDYMIGSRFGKLTVIKRVDDYKSPSGGYHKKYLCRCDCRKDANVLKEHLTSGRQRSCGCLKKHNGIRTLRKSKPNHNVPNINDCEK